MLSDNHLLWEQHINAFVTLCPDQARIGGPLSGLRIGVKDVIDVAGVPTRNGSDTCQGAAPAPRDAPVVATLRAAGAQIVGKTVTTEFAFTDPTTCRNPHDLNRSPGGSSSGSGAAVAAGVVDIALGTQTAGSLCRPAAYCGVVGFKPSFGLISTSGVTPLATRFDTVGIIAASVVLAKKAFAILQPSNAVPLHAEPHRVHCGLWKTDVAPDADTSRAFQAAVNAVKTIGWDSTEASLNADVDAVVAAHRKVMNFEAFTTHGAMLSDARARLLKPKFSMGLHTGKTISVGEAAQATGFLAQAQQDFWAGLDDTTLILTLSVPEGAPLMDGTTGFQDWLTPWTVFGGPLICLPWGADRLARPLSVMLAAPPGQDARLLAAAEALERHSPVLSPPQLPQV